MKLVLAPILLLLFYTSHATISLNNSCPFSNPKYLQFVGFTIIGSEEQKRLGPLYSGSYNQEGQWLIDGYKVWNFNANKIGINISGITYCVNFTVLMNLLFEMKVELTY